MLQNLGNENMNMIIYFLQFHTIGTQLCYANQEATLIKEGAAQKQRVAQLFGNHMSPGCPKIKPENAISHLYGLAFPPMEEWTPRKVKSIFPTSTD